MHLHQLFKLHHFTYFIWHIIYSLIVVASFSILYFFFKETLKDYLYYFLFSNILFSLVIGIYEYNSLSYTYLNLKLSKRSFFLSSLIYSIINSTYLNLIFVLICFLENMLGVKIDSYNNIDIYFFIFSFIVNILFFYLGSIISLIFSNIKIKYVLLTISLSIICLFGFKIYNLYYNFITSIDFDFYSIILGLSSIFFILLTLLLFKTKDITR